MGKDTMKHRALIWPFLICIALLSNGCGLLRGKQPPRKPRYGPLAAINPAATVRPDRIILTWSGDPATSQAVTWRTNTAVRTACAEIVPAGPGPDFHENAIRRRAETVRLRTDRGRAHHHSVEFTNLDPGTLYAYRVGSAKGWSEWFQFRTATGEEQPFEFIFLGDAQNNLLASWSRVLRGAYAQAPHARFCLHAGDLVSLGDSDRHWEGWFRAGAWLHATLPSIPAAGNHDYYSRKHGSGILTRHWRAQFTLPENGIAGLEETNYFIDYDGVRIIVLDSNRELEAQTSWLECILKDNPRRWTIALFHHPVYSAAWDRDNPELRALWRPLFDQYGVDLVLQGHDHTYARGTDQPGRDPEATEMRGPVYVVSVSGPKMYELPEERWMDRAAENIQLFHVISVDHEALHFAAYTAIGELFDAFDIVK